MAAKAKNAKAPKGKSTAPKRGNGNGNGHRRSKANGNGAVDGAEARRVATDLGRAMLIATSVETARHSDDVVVIAGAICEKLGVTEHARDDVLAAARLHDIGKASVPREVLDKPAPLSAGEWELMREHTVVGEQILASVTELEQIARYVRHSHERWDGGGYPDGLAGEKIPLGSRIIFAADAFHAIRSDRPYRAGRPASAALAEVVRCAGTQFDPTVTDALEEVVHELRIATPVRQSRRSSRLVALLLCLALGGGGSALARSGLLGTPEPVSGGPSPGLAGANPLACQTLDCSSLFGATLLEQLRQLGMVHGNGVNSGVFLTLPGSPPDSARGAVPSQSSGAADPRDGRPIAGSQGAPSPLGSGPDTSGSREPANNSTGTSDSQPAAPSPGTTDPDKDSTGGQTGHGNGHDHGGGSHHQGGGSSHGSSGGGNGGGSSHGSDDGHGSSGSSHGHSESSHGSSGSSHGSSGSSQGSGGQGDGGYHGDGDSEHQSGGYGGSSGGSDGEHGSSGSSGSGGSWGSGGSSGSGGSHGHH